MKRRKVTDAQLQNLAAAVKRLAGAQQDQLTNLQAQVDSLAGVVEDLRNVTAPGLAGDDAVSFPPLSAEDAALLEAEAEPEYDGRDDDRMPAPPEASYADDLKVALGETDTSAWEITETGARVYSAGGRSAFETLESLLVAALRDNLGNPAVLDLHVGFANSQDEEGLPFDGLLTVAV